MNIQTIHNFGLVDEKGDAFEFTVDSRERGSCRLVAVLQTERGPRRTEVANVPRPQWNAVAAAAVKELVSEMGENERGKKAPTLHVGVNRISPLVGRELGVLLIALMEEGAIERMDALLHSWRELAREERWWLYAKAAAPGQLTGSGWRRALFHAFSETPETRVVPSVQTRKQKLWESQEPLLSEVGNVSDPPPRTQAQAAKVRRSKCKTAQTPDDGQMRFF
jgi:hypothetical protein